MSVYLAWFACHFVAGAVMWGSLAVEKFNRRRLR